MLVVGDRRIPVPGRRVLSYLEHAEVRLSIPEDGRPRRSRWIRQIILHTTRGIPGGRDQRAQLILPGIGRSTWSRLNLARMWHRDDVHSGAHLFVDHDATIYCMADVLREATYHATTSNDCSVGIELKQGGLAELFSEQIEAAADLVDVLTLALGIQRQIPIGYFGGPFHRLDEDGGKGEDVVGVFGHRDQTSRRGAGDPGDAVFEELARRGYERHDFDAEGDLIAWKMRQAELGLPADGVPGPRTVMRLSDRGYRGGLWTCPPAERVG